MGHIKASKQSDGGDSQPNMNDGQMSVKQLSARGKKEGSKEEKNWDLERDQIASDV